jgi:hypothetical protein
MAPIKIKEGHFDKSAFFPECWSGFRHSGSRDRELTNDDSKGTNDEWYNPLAPFFKEEGGAEAGRREKAKGKRKKGRIDDFRWSIYE